MAQYDDAPYTAEKLESMVPLSPGLSDPTIQRGGAVLGLALIDETAAVMGRVNRVRGAMSVKGTSHVARL